MNYPTLKLNARGEWTRKWQRFLLANDYDIGPWGADGHFGGATMLATQRLQNKYELDQRDGIVRHQSWVFAEVHNLGLVKGVGIVGEKAVVPSAKTEFAAPLLKFYQPGYDLIVEFETGGPTYYDKCCARPSNPGHASGVTIGFGWDLRYNKASKFVSIWGETLGEKNTKRLLKYCQAVPPSNAFLKAHYSDIYVPWEAAKKVFLEDSVPRYWALTVNAFPGVELLKPAAQWAMLSLVFNRGASVRGSNRRRMLALHNLLKSIKVRGYARTGDYTKMGAITRDMISIWLGTTVYRGLRRRRLAEAEAFESCA